MARGSEPPAPMFGATWTCSSSSRCFALAAGSSSAFVFLFLRYFFLCLSRWSRPSDASHLPFCETCASSSCPHVLFVRPLRSRFSCLVLLLCLFLFLLASTAHPIPLSSSLPHQHQQLLTRHPLPWTNSLIHHQQVPAHVIEFVAPEPAETYAAPAPVSVHARAATLSGTFFFDIPVPQVVEEAAEVTHPIPQERFSKHVVEQNVDVSVPQDDDLTGPVAKKPRHDLLAEIERVSQFKETDWVIVERLLACVVRFGYRDFDGMVRVLRPDERFGLQGGRAVSTLLLRRVSALPNRFRDALRPRLGRRPPRAHCPGCE